MPDINLVPREYRERKERWKKVFSKTTGLIFFLLILSLLFYGGLLLYQKKLNTNIANIKNETAALQEKRTPDTEKEIINLDSKLSLLKSVFKNHVYWSGLFSKIEQLAIPNAYFSDIGLSLNEGEVVLDLSISTQTYTDLARQMLSFQEDSEVKSVEISDISLEEEGGISFGLSVTFPESILLINNEKIK